MGRLRTLGSFLKHLVLAIIGLGILAAPFVLRAVVIAIGLSVFTSQRALAWGDDGHRIIADLADRRLTPTAAHAVRGLLQLENETTLAQVSTWADDIKRQRPNTRPWHYVDIPISARGYGPARDCADDRCIIPKIEEFRRVLASMSSRTEDRLEALKFIVHLVGDLHQPLHCSDNGDRGGNSIKVRGYSGSENLHAVWDTGVIKRAGFAEPDYARTLSARITDADAAGWSRGTIVDWANESHAVARQFIYAHLPDASAHLPASYQAQAEPIVERQLERAGVRLAAVLNSTLR
jgi:hypothetical protein